MRTKLNLTGSTHQRIGQKLRMAALPLSSVRISGGPIRIPTEWMDAASWRLPSGQALSEFALQAGFLAPLLLRADRYGEPAQEAALENNAGLTKHFGKGGN